MSADLQMRPGESFRDFVERMHQRATYKTRSVQTGGFNYGELSPERTRLDAVNEIGRDEAEAIRAAANQLGIPLQQGGDSLIGTNRQVNNFLYGPDATDPWTQGVPDGPDYRGPEGDTREFQNVRDMLLGVGLNFAMPGIASIFGDTIAGGIGAVRQASGILDATEALGITGGQNSRGGMVDLMEEEAPDISSPLEGLLGGNIGIPIPGLPFPIPGNMTWEDLVEIARRTGRSIQDILGSVSNDSDTPPEEDADSDTGVIGRTGGGVLSRDEVGRSEDDPFLLPEEPLSTGQPPELPPEDDNWWPGGLTTGQPPELFPEDPNTPSITNPPEIPPENNTPGFTGDTVGLTQDTGNNSALFLGLLPFLAPDNENTPPPEYELWDYIGADDSWGWERPDYGVPITSPAFRFEDQPSQPIQVGYNPEPRRGFMSVIEQERRRRGLI